MSECVWLNTGVSLEENLVKYEKSKPQKDSARFPSYVSSFLVFFFNFTLC